MNRRLNMILEITDTKSNELKGVIFEDKNELVSSKDKAWLVNTFLLRYFSTKEKAIEWCENRGLTTKVITAGGKYE